MTCVTLCECLMHIQNGSYIIHCDLFQEYFITSKVVLKIVLELNSLTLESNRSMKLCGIGLLWMTVKRLKLNVEFGMFVVFVIKTG